MPTGILIPADENTPLRRQEFKTLSDYQAAVGGYIEAVDLRNPDSALYMNEEATIHRLPPNRRATLLLWVHNRSFMFNDELHGDVVLIGPPRAGNSTNTPIVLDNLLLEAKAFVVESTTYQQPAVWVARNRPFTSWDAAYGYAVKWTKLIDVKDVRVTAP